MKNIKFIVFIIAVLILMTMFGGCADSAEIFGEMPQNYGNIYLY